MKVCDIIHCSIESCQSDIICEGGLAILFGLLAISFIVGITFMINYKGGKNRKCQ